MLKTRSVDLFVFDFGELFMTNAFLLPRPTAQENNSASTGGY